MMEDSVAIQLEQGAPYTPEPVLPTLAGACETAGAPQVAAHLLAVRRWLEDDLQAIEANLLAQGEGELDLAELAAQHLLERPGKRIRPLCVLLAARLGAQAAERQQAVYAIAEAVELVHAATLLHDDVIDQGKERRGVPTARLVYGNTASVLGGDHLLIEALRRVAGGADQAILLDLMDVIGGMVRAEAVQLQARGEFTPDRQRYTYVIKGKTAAIFAWGMRAGALLAGAEQAVAEALANVGMALGMAFQIVDDTLDLEQASDALGKDRLADLREGKLTLPLILACEQDAGLQAAISDVLQQHEPRDEDWAVLRRRIVATGCAQQARVCSAEYAQQAHQSLAALPKGPAVQALAQVVDALTQRQA